MKDLIYLLPLAILVFIFAACGEELDDSEINFGYAYFPTEIGQVNVYQVDSTIYNLFSDSVYTHTWQVREEVIGEDTDAEGRPRFRLDMRQRQDDISWNGVSPTIWYSVKTPEVAERLEGNLRFLKLVFPTFEGEQWKGNSYIDTEDAQFVGYNDWLYRITEVDAPKTVGATSYDKSLTVVQNDFSNLQQKIYAEEVYAEGIGLVFKEYQDLKLQAPSLPPLEESPWPNRANDGVVVRWTRIE